MDQTNLRYDLLIENHLEHLKREYHRLWTDAVLPQFWFLTTTFVPVESKRDDHLSIPPHRCFVFFEQFYVRLLSRLMNNFERKRWLQPLTYVYIDYPFTKREKTYATLSLIEQFLASPFHFYPEHPETTCHIHSVMLIAPKLVARFETIQPSLANLFQSLGPAHCTLHPSPCKLMTISDVRSSTRRSYSSSQRVCLGGCRNDTGNHASSPTSRDDAISIFIPCCPRLRASPSM
jgi:hypothetical protein